MCAPGHGWRFCSPETRWCHLAPMTYRSGQVRDAIALALAGLVLDTGGSPVPCGIVPDDPPALGALRAALAQEDLVVVSAGSSVDARDATADAVADLGKPGIFCHGLAVEPGKPTLLGPRPFHRA